MPTLKGEKVVLRGVGKNDLPKLLEWFNDSEVIQYLHFYLPLTELAEEKWLEKISLSEKETVFIIDAVEKENTRPIGICGLHEIHPKDRSANLGIAIGDKNYWSHGYGIETAGLLVCYGFEQLNLHRISSCVYAFNDRSFKMHLKIGFKEEGRQREAIFKNNRYVDVIILGLLKREWK